MPEVGLSAMPSQSGVHLQADLAACQPSAHVMESYFDVLAPLESGQLLSLDLESLKERAHAPELSRLIGADHTRSWCQQSFPGSTH